MYYINAQPNASGNHGNPVSAQREGMAALPDELLAAYIEAKGFANVTVENGVVTAVEVNQTALDAYLAGHPDTPEPESDPALSWDALADAIREGVNEV